MCRSPYRVILCPSLPMSPCWILPRLIGLVSLKGNIARFIEVGFEIWSDLEQQGTSRERHLTDLRFNTHQLESRSILSICQEHAIGRGLLVNHSSVLHTMSIKNCLSFMQPNDNSVHCWFCTIWNQSDVAADFSLFTPEQVTHILNGTWLRKPIKREARFLLGTRNKLLHQCNNIYNSSFGDSFQLPIIILTSWTSTV